MSPTDNEITPQKLKRSYWYVTNRAKLKAITAGLLIFLIFGLFAYSVVSLLIYVIEMEDDSRMVYTMSFDLVNFDGFKIKRSPKNIKVSAVSLLRGVLPSREGNYIYYDLSARIENINQRHRAEFSYRFTCNNWKGDLREGFVLPAEKKYILELGVEATESQCTPGIEIGNVSWQRLSRHSIPDTEVYKQQHLNMKIKDVEFVPAIEIVDEGGVALTNSKVRFKAVNFSAYSFWLMPMNVILMRGNQVLGVNRFIIDKFKSGSERSGEVFWNGTMGLVDNIVIEPDINIFDPEVFASLSSTNSW